MRDVFARNVQDSRVAIQEGTFDSTGLEDGWADLIVIAQVRCFFHLNTKVRIFDVSFFLLKAFHWCPDYNAACAEFGRILKPNGALAFIWNLENRRAPVPSTLFRFALTFHEPILIGIKHSG
jgi:SAM-dependent methyltransferase